MADGIVKEAIEAFRLADEAENDNRIRALEDIRFCRLREHWPETVKLIREDEKRPCLVIDKLGEVRRQVVNQVRQNRPATLVHPVDSKADIETAEVLTGLIRNIEASSDADVAYDTAVEAAIDGGFGYWRINIDYALNALDEDGIRSAGESAFDKNIFIRRVANQFAVYGDPYSQAADSADWMQAHVVERMTRDQFEKAYPGADQVDFDGHAWADVKAPWKDGNDVLVAEYWKREKVVKKALAVQLADETGLGEVVIMFEDEFAKEKDVILGLGGSIVAERPVLTHKVTQYMVTGAEELSKTDWPGAYIPIVPVYGDEVNIEGVRHLYSLINAAKDAQRNFNYWRSAETEMVALAPKVPFIGPKGAFNADHAKWSTANSQSHAFIEYDGPQSPQRQPPVPIPSGMMQEALSASDDIKSITGIYDASLGARSNETSGVAIRARQNQGDTSTFHFSDNLSRAHRHSGRIIVDLIPKVYSTARMVRILGEDGRSDEIKLNEQFEDAKGMVRMHDVRVGRYDVTVRAGPSFNSRREEAVYQMTEFVRSYPDAAPVIGDILARNMDWPGADEIAKRLEKILPPEIRDEDGNLPPEVQQQMQQMMEAINVLKGELSKADSERALKERELGVKEYEAATERLQAIMGSIDPVLLQSILGELNQDLAATSAGLPGGYGPTSVAA